MDREPAEPEPVSSDDAYIRPLDDSSQPEPSPNKPRRRRWLSWAPLVLAVVLGTAAVVVLQPTDKPDEPTTTASSEPPATDTREAAPSQQKSPQVIDVDHPLLGISAEWELFALGKDQLVRFQFAENRVVTTAVPDFNSSDRRTLLVGPDRVVVRPRTGGPSYVVPDGQSARSRPDTRRLQGPAFPGPEPGTVWARSPLEGQPGATRQLSLWDLSGNKLGVTLTYPAHSRPLVGDGRGNVLFNGIGGVYVGTPNSLHKVTTGALIAAGPSAFLVLECDERANCSNVVVNRTTGARHALPGDTTLTTWLPWKKGITSPDGSTAAVIGRNPSRASTVTAINLATGATHSLMPVRMSPSSGQFVFSPDGQWLFVASSGNLHVFDTTTWRARTLEVDIPTIKRLAIRPAAP